MIGSAQMSSTVNPKAVFAAIVSGGSIASWSLTRLASTVTVQLSPSTKSLSGSSVKVVGPPDTVAVCAPLVVQDIVNQLPVTLTASLKVIVTEPFGDVLPPGVGAVLATDGAMSVR